MSQSTPTHFFIFSLGPVQSFIAQARKAQDLYLGCRMVSDYCRYAALTFKQKGGEIIFPEVDSASLTNRFVGTIRLENGETGEKIGQEVAQAVQARFVAEGLTVMKAALGGNMNPSQIKGLKEQLKTHLQTYWIFSPYEAENYTKSYREAERVFGMSKHLRTPKAMVYQGSETAYGGFKQGFLGETGRKCIVDGERNVKVYRWSQQDRAQYNSVGALLRNKLFLKSAEEVALIERYSPANQNGYLIRPKVIEDGEGLSAVSLFKRCYKPDEKGDWNDLSAWKRKNNEVSFPSTARVAIKDSLQKAGGPALSDMENALEGIEEDEFYLEENLTDKNFRKHGLIKEKERKPITQAQRAFAQAVKDRGGKLHPYYALVALDIDGLGKHLQHIDSKNDHEKTAEHLHQFAMEVAKLVEATGKGRVLHAGGDDFLLMLNLHGLFKLLGSIRDKWSGLRTPLSYSTSIIIAHYKSPLTRAVQTAKAELKAVKARFEGDGKDGIACCFMMKSGAVSTSYFKQDKLSLLQGLFQALQQGDYSPQFIFQLAYNMETMGLGGETDATEQEQLRDYTLRELKRLLARARNSSRVDKKAAIALGNRFSDLLLEQLQEGDTHFNLPNFLQFLKMAELAAKHTNLWPQDTSK